MSHPLCEIEGSLCIGGPDAVLIMNQKIKVGFQAFVSDGGEEFGAVRAVAPGGRPELVIYVENSGDFVIPLDAVESVHSEKGDPQLCQAGDRLRRAIRHAHEAEKPGF
jgi:hypothetical protein